MAIAPLLVDYSIGSPTGSSQSLLAFNATRTFLIIHNPDATHSLAFTIGATAAVNTGGSFTLLPGGTLLLDQKVAPNAFKVICTMGSAGVTCWANPS